MPDIQKTGPFNIQEVNQAPDQPGLYIWYSKLDVGRADWHSMNAGSEEIAKTSFLKALNGHSNKFAKQEIDLTAKANFSTIWNGTLVEDATSRFGGINIDGEVIHSALDSTLSSDESREALLSVLEIGFPFFYSPLYIGMTSKQTLKTRLTQHQDAYMKLFAATDNNLLIDGIDNKTFAERAVSFGFRPGDLFYFTLSFKAEKDSCLGLPEISSLIIASEWLLNRWSTPTLGRR